MKKIVLMMVMLLLFSFDAKADLWMYGFKINCMPELDLLTIEPHKFHGNKAYYYAQEHPKELLNKYGLYVIDSLVKPGKSDASPYEIKTVTQQCKLGKITYRIEIEPTDATLGGDWHGCPSAFNITLYENEKLLIDKLTNVQCRPDYTITHFFLEPDFSNLDSSFFRIIGTNSEDKIEIKDFWLDNDFVPVTNDNFYQNNNDLE